MKRILLFASFIALMASCINEQESINVARNREMETIKKYLETEQIPNIRTVQDEQTGIVMLWTKENLEGQRPNQFDSVNVNYTGSLLDGRVFDTSIDSVARANNIHNPNRRGGYIPLKFVIGRTDQVIQGFDLAVYNMKKGDKAVVIIPSPYAYGNRVSGGIPANSILRFDLELVEIKTQVSNP